MKNPLNLLVVDDNPDDRLLYRRILKVAFGERLTLTEESSGDRTFDAIENSKPHCVLLDYSLPGRNGSTNVSPSRQTFSRGSHSPRQRYSICNSCRAV